MRANRYIARPTVIPVHRAWIGEVDGLVTAAESGTQPDKVKLAQLKKGLQEQHETLDRLSKDILALVEEEAAMGMR